MLRLMFSHAIPSRVRAAASEPASTGRNPIEETRARTVAFEASSSPATNPSAVTSPTVGSAWREANAVLKALTTWAFGSRAWSSSAMAPVRAGRIRGRPVGDVDDDLSVERGSRLAGDPCECRGRDREDHDVAGRDGGSVRGDGRRARRGSRGRSVFLGGCRDRDRVTRSREGPSQGRSDVAGSDDRDIHDRGLLGLTCLSTSIRLGCRHNDTSEICCCQYLFVENKS